jgi:RNA polymerase sigma-70 factor (ECF subfamily)
VGQGQTPFVLATRQQADDPVPATGPFDGEFSQIFSGEFRYVYNTLKRLGVPGSDLEDLTHDVFLTVYRHMADRDRERPLRPWLFAFAYRTASAHRRLARHRREVIGSEPDACAPEVSSLERMVQAEQLALVQAALEKIDLEHRAVFILHDLDDTPMAQVASSLGIPTNTGYSRLRAARRKFETALARLQQRGGQ